jgi:hypothetical protein
MSGEVPEQGYIPTDEELLPFLIYQPVDVDDIYGMDHLQQIATDTPHTEEN